MANRRQAPPKDGSPSIAEVVCEVASESEVPDEWHASTFEERPVLFTQPGEYQVADLPRHDWCPPIDEPLSEGDDD